MKQILCVVDLSDSSAKVLEVAGKIAAPCGAHLHVLYPYRLIDHNHRGDMTSLKRKLESQAHDQFQKLKGTIPGLANTTSDFQPEIGFIADRINARLSRNNIDMIIISQQQADAANDIRSFDLQTTLRQAQLPFVIVPSTTINKSTLKSVDNTAIDSETVGKTSIDN